MAFCQLQPNMCVFMLTVIKTIITAVTLAAAQQNHQHQLDNNGFSRSRGSFKNRGNRRTHFRAHTYNNRGRYQGRSFSASGYNNYYQGFRLQEVINECSNKYCMGIMQIVTYCTVTFIVMALASTPEHSVIHMHVCEPAEVIGVVNL